MTEERRTGLRPEVEVRDPDSLPATTGSDLHDDYEALTHDSILALFSGTKRVGPWEPPDRMDVNAIFGQITLDFREAVLPPSGIVEIRATAIFGAVNVLVPDGAEVEMRGQPIFGQFERRSLARRASERLRDWVRGESAEDRDEFDEEPPLFRVTGVAVFGGVEVKGRE